MGRFLAFLVERFSSNQAVSDDLGRQPQEKNYVNRLFFLLSKAPFYAVSRWGWVVSNFGAFGNLFFRPLPPAGGGGATHRQKSLYHSLGGTPGDHTYPLATVEKQSPLLPYFIL